LEARVQSMEAFEQDIEDGNLRDVFNSLKIAACSELQGGMLATRCWQRACR